MKNNQFFVLGMAAVLLTFVFALTGCPTGTGGGGDDPVNTNPVTPPVEISSLAQLTAIGANAANMGKNYKLTADISGVTEPISMFSGNFDGNGHTVTLNITSGYTVSDGTYPGTFAGLFGMISGKVHDLTVTGAITVTTSDDMPILAGGVAGAMSATASISNVVSSVNVSAAGSGNDDVLAGGIVGAVQGTVSNARATGDVSATASGTGSDITVNVGGVVGGLVDGVLNRVYATGNVSGTSAGDKVRAGGVVGAGDQSTVSNAYATGNVSATSTGTAYARAGGVSGSSDGGTLSYVYATGNVSVTGNNSEHAEAAGVLGKGDSASVQNAVALNSSVGITGTASPQRAQRVIGWDEDNDMTMANNYGKADLTPTVTVGSYTADTGAGNLDGEDITVSGGPLPAAYTAPDETWWKNTAWSGADWNTVWEWDTGTGLPKLR
jgi:hypothetical protein